MDVGVPNALYLASGAKTEWVRIMIGVDGLRGNYGLYYEHDEVLSFPSPSGAVTLVTQATHAADASVGES